MVNVPAGAKVVQGWFVPSVTGVAGSGLSLRWRFGLSWIIDFIISTLP